MPNELYIEWLKEWMDRAYETHSKGYKILRTAYQSMQDCPFDLGHPSNAAQLKGIAQGLCQKLEKRLVAHCKQHNVAMPERPGADTRGSGDEVVAPVKAKRKRQYVPAFRSGAYALLIALSDPAVSPDITKMELIAIANSHCDASFDVPGDKSGYNTAWSAMKTLREKDLVLVKGNPPKYTISLEGEEIAAKIRAALGETVAEPETEVSAMPAEDIIPCSVNDSFTPITIPAGTFQVQIIIDNREVKTARDRAFIEEQFYIDKIDLVTRSLDVGDVLWVAKTNDGREYVLDHIVERKRMDDLLSSIKDGRFHEQKFRLKRCGAQNVIYLIEETHMTEVPRFQEALESAISSTQVVDNFFVKRVPNLDYSVRYLRRLTKKLQALYEGQTLYAFPDNIVDSRTFRDLSERTQADFPEKRHYLSYHAFSSISKKSLVLHVGDVWLKMLLTIRGVSLEKAYEIRKAYPTLRHLLDAYASCGTPRDRESLMCRTCSGFGRKAIGNALSKRIASIFE